MDVHADAEVGGQAGGRRQRVVGARERGVHADHPASAGAQEALVLGEPTPGAVGAVAVGDAVRAHDAHADLGARLGDHVEAALDRVRALVVVDDPGRAAQQRLERRRAGRDARSMSRSRAASSRHQICSRIWAKSVGVVGGAGMPRASAE